MLTDLPDPRIIVGFPRIAAIGAATIGALLLLLLALGA